MRKKSRKLGLVRETLATLMGADHLVVRNPIILNPTTTSCVCTSKYTSCPEPEAEPGAGPG